MITSIIGPNLFEVEKELKSLRSKFDKNYGNLAIEQLDADEADYQSLYDSLTSLPFLSPKKMVVIKNGGSNKDFVANIESLTKNLSENTDLIIIEAIPDKRSSYYKFLKKLDNKEFSDSSDNLVKWVVDYASGTGAKISFADAKYLIDMAGTDQLKLSNELDKLAIYNESITRESIDLLIVPIPQSTIFQLLDAAFAGKRKQVLDIYEDQRLQRVEPGQIIGMLAWQLHILAVVKSAGDRSISEIASEAKLNPFVVRKSKQITDQLSTTELKDIISRTLKLDYDMKSKNIDADDALKHLLLSIIPD